MAPIDSRENYAQVKAWRKANPDKVNAQARRRRQRHPDKVAAVKKRYRQKHGDRLRAVEAEQARRRRRNDPEGNRRRIAAYRERQRAKQAHALGRPRPRLCELCDEPGHGQGNKPGSGICFDHCHATGRPRGWLCDRCNKVLGLVRDSAQLLRRMASYLETHSHGTVNHTTPELTPIERICCAWEALPSGHA
jgi:Recombination endonuclease VII